MLADRIVGLWSDVDLYQGVMEAADLAFCPDGTGWVDWSNFGGGFFVLRFTWELMESDRLILNRRAELSGTWELSGNTTRYHVEDEKALAERLILRYRIVAGQDALEQPATLLELDRDIYQGFVFDRFAFRRTLRPGERDRAAVRAE